MENVIVEETRELWWENIIYIIDNSKSTESAAEGILVYLEEEGAFTVANKIEFHKGKGD